MQGAKERTRDDTGGMDDASSIGTVLVVGPSPDSIGGMATVVAQMVRLAEAGTLPLTVLPLTESTGVDESLASRVRRHLRFTQSLVRRVRTERATIVHLHTCSGASFLRSVVDGVAARFAGARVILHIHGAKFDEFFRAANLVSQRVIRGALERADAVIALSAGWKERLLEIAPAARIVVVENAVEEPSVTRERTMPADRVGLAPTPVSGCEAVGPDVASLEPAAYRHCSQSSGTRVSGVSSPTLAVARMGHPEGEDHCSQSSGTPAVPDPNGSQRSSTRVSGVSSPTLAVARMGHPESEDHCSQSSGTSAAPDPNGSQSSGTRVSGVSSPTLAVARMGHPEGEDHCSQSSGTQAAPDPNDSQRSSTRVSGVSSPTLAVARMGHLQIESVPRSTGASVRFVALMRLDAWKGVDELLLAAQMLAARGVDFELKIAGPAGSAYSESTLRSRVASLGLDGCVRYVGVVIGREKSELLASSDVYVQSSHHEGLPLAVLEAMVHGLAVVATAVGATAEFVDPGRHGLLVRAKDAVELAGAMEVLASDPERREAMGRAGCELGRTRFSIERFARELLAVYRTLAADHGL